MSYQKDIFSLIARFSGQENMLSVPRAFCEATGSLEAGMLLSQLLYWSDKGNDPEGWFYKSYIEWAEHLFLTEYQVRKFSKQFENAGFLEVKLKKVNGSPTLHYRIKRGEFSEWILKNLRIESAKFPNPNPKISESNNKETETTTETTNKEVSERERARAATPPTTVTPTPAQPPATPPSETATATSTAEKTRMGSDDYDHPAVKANAAPPSSGRPSPTSPHIDGRKFVGGRIPAGQGANAVEVFYERYSINQTKLSAPKEDDLIAAVTDLGRWRAVVVAWEQSDYKPSNIKGQLDWYREGIPERNNGAGNGTGFGLTAYAEKERKQYERDYGPDEELTPEKEQWIWEQKRKLAERNRNTGV